MKHLGTLFFSLVKNYCEKILEVVGEGLRWVFIQATMSSSND